MLDDNESHPGTIGYRLEKLAARIEAARGRTDADGQKAAWRGYLRHVWCHVSVRLPGGDGFVMPILLSRLILFRLRLSRFHFVYDRELR